MPDLKHLCVYLAMVLEPLCHVLGIPHPEGMAEMAATWLASEA